MKRNILYFLECIMLICVMSLSATPVQAENYVKYAECTKPVELRKDVIGYQYKTVNGIRYRRLYNFTTKKPLGKWERF